MSSSPDKHSSNINIKLSEQRLDQELNNITPVIGNVIKSLFNSVNASESLKSTPVASQLLAAIPQLHAVLQNTNEVEKKQTPIGQIRNSLNKSIDQSLNQFDTLIETPMVQQLLNTLDANPDAIKQAVHMHNASIQQRLTAFTPIVNAVHHRSENLINDILSHPDHLVTILFEHSPELVTNFLAKKGFGKEQLETFIRQIPSKSSISKDELIEKLQTNDQNGEMHKIENELKQSSNDQFTLNDCLKQLTSSPNLQAFSMIINQIGQSVINQTKK